MSRARRQPDPSAALGLIAEGVGPVTGSRCVGDPLRVADPGLRHPGRGCAHGADLRDELRRAGQVRAPDGAVLIFAETDAHADKIEPSGRAPELRKVLRIDSVGATGADALTDAGRSVDARRTRRRLAVIKSSDPATLIYTSGTTARPKGCQLTHSNLVYEIRGGQGGLSGLAGQGRTDAGVPPLAHVLARAITIAAFANKVTLGSPATSRTWCRPSRCSSPRWCVSVPRGVREGLQHRRADRATTARVRIFEIAATPDRVEPGPGHRRTPGLVLRRQARAVRRAGLRQAARHTRGDCHAAIFGGAPLGARLGHFYRGVGLHHHTRVTA